MFSVYSIVSYSPDLVKSDNKSTVEIFLGLAFEQYRNYIEIGPVFTQCERKIYDMII